ncbi:MAG: class B sortase [Lachnospiraceae bacterium]|nr:class B sortase [Lachnospiraceae bacterium]
MKKRTKKKIGIAICAAIAAIAAYNVYTIRVEYAKAGSEYADVAGAVYMAEEEAKAIPVEETVSGDSDFSFDAEDPQYDIGTYPNLVIDHEALKKTNPDYLGWLYVPCLEISYPVVQGEDNDYYLHHTFEDTENISGCIFIDAKCEPDMSSYNTFVYGHNMKNGSMFGSLRKLLTNGALIKEDPYVYFYTADGVYAYRTYSYHRVPPKSGYFAYVKTHQEYSEYVDMALSDRLEDMDTSVDKRKNSIVLSTCNGSGESKQRLVIHAINIGYYKPAE